MANINTRYMGLELQSPIIVGSSSLTGTVEKIKHLEEVGAGAVVLKSLFEEQTAMEAQSYHNGNEASGHRPEWDEYISNYVKQHNVDQVLTLVEQAKRQTKIPVIGSISCVSSSEWVSFAKKLESAGADAIELNMFILPVDVHQKGEGIENLYLETADKVKSAVEIPVSMKLGCYFSGLAYFMRKISRTGLQALVLFNRFYKPDIDLEKMEIKSADVFSSPDEIHNVLRWIGLLSGEVDSDLAASTGIHDGDAVIKALLAGANAVQVVSALYKKGPDYIKTINKRLSEWMDSKNFASIEDFRGKMSHAQTDKPMIYERAQFMKYYSDTH